MRDPYEVLELTREASQEEIKAAYRRLARRFHPDVNPDDRQAEERFKEIGQAYTVLSDPERRDRFDRFGTADEQVPVDFGGGFGDLFDMFFGGEGVRGRRRTGRDGDDVRADIEISLLEVVTGVEKSVKFARYARCKACAGTGSEAGAAPLTCQRCGGAGMVSQIRNTFIGQVRTSTTCTACGGTGQVVEKLCRECDGVGLTPEELATSVTIPSGVGDGMTMRVPGNGCEGLGTGKNGDLYVVVHVAPDARFQRSGLDLISSVSLSFPQASLGDTVDVQGLDSDYEVEIPRGTQPGTVLKIESAGLPPLHGGRRGDLLMHVQVEVPTDLTQAQENLIGQLAELRGEGKRKPPAEGGLLGGLFKGAKSKKGK